MKIIRNNPFTGKLVEKEIDVKPEDLEAWENGEGNIQNIMPYLSADDREFIMTGILPEQWEDTFGIGSADTVTINE
jgi:hypothetical protein